MNFFPHCGQALCCEQDSLPEVSKRENIVIINHQYENKDSLWDCRITSKIFS